MCCSLEDFHLNRGSRLDFVGIWKLAGAVSLGLSEVGSVTLLPALKFSCFQVGWIWERTNCVKMKEKGGKKGETWEKMEFSDACSRLRSTFGAGYPVQHTAKANTTSPGSFGCVLAINHCKGIQTSTALEPLLGLGLTALKNKPWQELCSPQ